MRWNMAMADGRDGVSVSAMVVPSAGRWSTLALSLTLLRRWKEHERTTVCFQTLRAVIFSRNLSVFFFWNVL